MTRINRREMIKGAVAFAMAPGLLHLTAQHSIALTREEADRLRKLAESYEDAKLVDDAPPLPGDDEFTIVLMPDTQNYSQGNPDLYYAQTKWIADHAEDRRIACVLHLGDITNRNTPVQWEVAKKAMYHLDGKVPYFMCLGNHDYGDNGRANDRSTLFHNYFPRKKYSKLPNFGGSYDKEPDRFDNSYHTFKAGGRDYLVLALEFGPRKDVVRWANEVVTAHPDHAAILITHAYMYFDDTRYNYAKHKRDQVWTPHHYGVAKLGDEICDGQALWEELVSRHDNFILTANGHVLGDGLGMLTSKNKAGRNVHQMLFNCQFKPGGGDGWLRLLHVSNDGKKIDVHTYSPALEKSNVTEANQFTLEY